MSELGLDALCVLNHSPAVTYIVSVEADPTLVFVSNSVCDMLGYRPEQFVDRPGFLTSIVHVDDVASFTATFETALRYGDATHDRRMQLASGEWRWFRDHFRIVRDADGKPDYGIGSIFDVNSEKLAQQVLEVRRSELSVLTEHSSDLISRVTVDGKFIYQSPSAKRVMGFEADARHGQSALAQVHPDDLRFIETAWRAALRTKQAQRYSYRAFHAEGRWMTLEAVMNPVVDLHTHAVTEFVIVSRDISERVETERRLVEARKTIEEQSEIYGLFARHGSDFFVRLSIDGVVTHVSPSSERIIGRQSLMAPGARLGDIVHEDDRGDAGDAWRRAIAAQASRVFRARVQHEDGRWIWLETAVTPIVSADSDEVLEVIALSRDVTPQIAADEALTRAHARIREQSELYDLFASQGSEIFMRIALDGQLLHISPSHVHVLGSGTLPADGKVIDAIHSEDLDLVRQTFALVRQLRAPRSCQHRYRHADGHWVWLDVSVSPVICASTGEVTEFIATCRDVDEQLLREAQLAEAQKERDVTRAQLRLVSDNIADIVTLFRPDGSIAYMSPSVEKVTGYSREEMERGDAPTIICGDDQKLVTDERARNRLGEVTASLRYRARHRDGRILWLERRASAVTEHDFGEGVAVLSIIRDVTSDVEQERVLAAATAALEVSRSQLESIIDNSIDVIAVFDAERRMRYLSKSCEQQSGYTVEEFFAGRAELVHPEDERVVVEALRREDEGGEGETFTYRGIRKDGSVIWLERRARKVYDPATGALRSIVAVTRDISEEHRHREEMATANAQLERSKIAAETANVAKSQFLATMSHELRTPMTGVMGMLDLMKGTNLTIEQSRFANLAYESAENLLVILNDVLDFSKIEAGQLNLHLAPMVLRTEIEKVSALLTPVAHKRGNTLSLRIEDDVPGIVMGDDMRLRQILFNLVGNAIKFTSEGLVRVEVRRTPRDRLRFEVHDTGIGIPESTRDKLFRPFVQGDGSSSRKAGGTGLGLAISKSLVEVMGGSIGFESADGKGAVFWFELPLRLAEEAQKPDAPAMPASQSGQRRSFDILVAEDHPVNQQLLAALLRRERHRVTIVANGQLAVEAVRNTRFDLVLMDVQMPVLDGVGATQQIRAMAGSASVIPIVAITANALRGDMESYLAAGMTGYVSKPIRIEVLREAIERAVPLADRQRSAG